MDASSTTEPFRFSADAAAEWRGGDSPPDSLSANPATLVLETKREIRRLVQSVASLCHSRVTAQRFWPRFLSDVGTALAADGGIIWHRSGSLWISIAHNGAIDRRLIRQPGAPDGAPAARETTAQRPQSAAGGAARQAVRHCHDQMIFEIGHGGGPVLVPPGAAWEDAAAGSPEFSEGPAGDRPPIEPGNPTESLAAVVPIPIDPDEPVEWMIELFLPLGGGPATHRGYLRFAAQMADLAADYLRGERLRQARKRADQAARMQAALIDLYRCEDRAAAERRVVDAAAKLFSAERVSLVSRRNQRWTVVAVSGVDQIDPSLPAVQIINQIAADASGPTGFIAAAPAAEDDSPGSSSSDATDSATCRVDGEASDGCLTLRGVGIVDAEGDLRLVVEDNQLATVDADQDHCWAIFLTHTALVLRQCDRLQQSGWHRWIRPSRRGAPFSRPVVWTAGVLGLLLIGAVPVPLIVTAEARLEPRQVQMLYAPRDSVVAEIWVEHGGAVESGEALLRLADPELDRSIDALVGRRAVLQERAGELRARLVSRTANDTDEAERLETEQRITDEELRSVATELAVLDEERKRLVLRSDRSGIVDAWQMGERLTNRPVRRGQSLFRVVAPEGGWTVEADVPQNRLDHVIAISAEGPATADIVLSAFPDRPLTGRLERIGPASRTNGSEQAGATPSEPTGAVTFAVQSAELPLLQPGAPARVGMPCGHRPLAYVACQDLVRTIVGSLRLYW